MAVQRWFAPMVSRSPDEKHRTATPLELFFDLVFVVAVAQAANELHHAIADGDAGTGIVRYGMVFFAIWWCWMNFTWFASAYDTDDIPYRLTIFVYIAGALILAAGIPRGFNDGDFSVAVAGYVVMRLSLVSLWLRAGFSDAATRTVCFRYAFGVAACQAGWVAIQFLPNDVSLTVWPALALAEVLVPVWAEQRGPTRWNAEHMAERYGLFTIIVLGESILAASLAIQTTIDDGDLTSDLTLIIIGGLLIVLAMWWLYFERPMHDLLTSVPRAFFWGYSHLVIWAAAAAVGAGIAVAIDHSTDHSSLSDFGAGAAVAMPSALFLVMLWLVHEVPRGWPLSRLIPTPLVAALVMLTPFTEQASLLTGLLLSALLAWKLAIRHEPPLLPER